MAWWGVQPTADIRFLDLEVEVDSSDEGLETDDGEDDLIKDNSEEELQEGIPVSHASTNLRNSSSDGSGFLPPEVDGNSTKDVRKADGMRRDDSVQGMVVEDPGQRATTSLLWCIKCTKGHEYDVILFLFGYTQAHPQHSSTFPSIHYRRKGEGLVYLSTTDDTLAAAALKDCPFVRKSTNDSNGIDMKLLTPDESEASLIVSEDDHLLQPGMWVRLCDPSMPSWLRRRDTRQTPQAYGDRKRLAAHCAVSEYHDDPAMIVKADATHVTVLFLPRLPTKHFLDPKLKPALRSTQFQWLFQPDFFNVDFRSKLDHRGFTFVDGLREETLPRHHVRPSSQPLGALEGKLFLTSNHPLVLSHFPEIDGWNFEIGGLVEGMKLKVTGVVTEISDKGLILRGDGDSDDHSVGWAARKIWKAGELVRHIQNGAEGLVIANNDDRHTTTFVGRMNITNTSEDGVTKEQNFEYEADSNLLRRLHAVYFFAVPHPQAATKETSPVSIGGCGPWLRREVMVSGKSSGEHRGQHALVVGVLTNQPTSSGLKLRLQSALQGNSAPPFIVDYDSAVDAATGEPLHIQEYPTNSPYRIKRGYRHPMQPKLKPTIVAKPTTPPPEPNEIPMDEDDVGWSGSDDEDSPLPPWCDQAHPSQRWIYSLRDNPIVNKLWFFAILTGRDPKLKINFNRSEKMVRLRFSALIPDEWCLEYQHLAFRLVQLSFIVEPSHPNSRTNDPFYVLHGEHSGRFLVRVSNAGDTLLCHEVDIETGSFDESVKYRVARDQACKILLRQEIKDKLAKQRKAYQDKHPELYRKRDNTK
ncbi:hypothetical protein Moror_12182 [Moniliophthora roreri MCA 2997]|uniref:Uncharacterized protein n=1 Tax=Moniliophthora roreri (strain MCA 2997) TaxID=1381753 RepID=V2WLC5_MONRO|nr:hypothetical protein Moror_12182 [Moniliophthora roreri MCA 2997]